MRTPTLLLLLLASTALAQTPILVKDINPGSANGFPDNNDVLVSIGNTVYFAADDAVNGSELWRSDGTDAGTYMVKDIQPGSTSSGPVRFTVLGNQVLFFANDGVHGDELWVTDGTSDGTTLVKDINPGPGHSIRRNFIQQKRDRMVMNGILYFAADNGTAYSQLWRTDGTEGGTVFVRNVCPGCTATIATTGQFTVLNDSLYVVSDQDLWRSDGTTAGTSLVVDNLDDDGPGLIFNLAAANGALYMSGGQDIFSLDLWVSDGTKIGTKLLKDLPDTGAPHEFTALGDKVFFISDDNLWSTDGTEAGTQMESFLVMENVFNRKNNLYRWNDEVYYRAKAADNQSYIYKTDGSPNGETQVFTQNYQGTSFSDPIFFASTDEYLFYDAINQNPISSGIARIHKSGTPMEILPIPNCILTEYLHIAGDNLFFRAKNNLGEELWKLSLLTSATSHIDHHLDVTLYPTLSTEGVFYFKYPVGQLSVLDLEVFDALGRLAHRTKQSLDQPLNLSTLSTGAYFARMVSEDGKFVTQKIIVGR
jgi:ELWxxDGT repeat protein